MSIELSSFTKSFAATFDEETASAIDEHTAFKKLKDWDSLQALTIIAMADEEFGLILKGSDLQNATTVEDLFLLITNK